MLWYIWPLLGHLHCLIPYITHVYGVPKNNTLKLKGSIVNTHSLLKSKTKWSIINNIIIHTSLFFDEIKVRILFPSMGFVQWSSISLAYLHSVRVLRLSANVKLACIIQLLQLVSSADWSKVHHVTHGIFCNDRWWRFAGHYSIEPTGHYLRARVLWILYCKLGLRVQNPHPIRTDSCARFLIVEPTDLSVKFE